MDQLMRPLCLLVATLFAATASLAAEPASMDDLFLESQAGSDTAADAAGPTGADTPAGAGGLDALFEEPVPGGPDTQEAAATSAWTGFFQSEAAYTVGSPQHWSKLRNRLYLSSTGRSLSLPWKVSFRVDYDPLYHFGHQYPESVRKDQRFEAQIRETYVDIPAGDLEFRVGRQHIIWGEMVGLFFADVVSAKDLRELALPDFELIRIPQWAVRGEYFNGDFHAEAVWIPYMTYNDIGKPGAEFYPFAPPAGTRIGSEHKPRGTDDDAAGVRLSYLWSGWDLSGFYYTSRDGSPAFAKASPTVWELRHPRIHQFGATLGKDLGSFLVKAEAVYSLDKPFNTLDPLDADGLVDQDILDAIVGLEWHFPEDTRFNAQLYQRRFADHDPNIVPKSVESGFSVLFSTKALHPDLESEILFISSLERDDWSTQARLTWRFDGSWRLAFGADIFQGSPQGLFGYYDNRDRVYSELRYDF